MRASWKLCNLDHVASHLISTDSHAVSPLLRMSTHQEPLKLRGHSSIPWHRSFTAHWLRLCTPLGAEQTPAYMEGSAVGLSSPGLAGTPTGDQMDSCLDTPKVVFSNRLTPSQIVKPQNTFMTINLVLFLTRN